MHPERPRCSWYCIRFGVGLQVSRIVVAILESLLGSRGARWRRGVQCMLHRRKKDMARLSSGESELIADVGGPCEGVATRSQRCKMCGCANGTNVSSTHSSAALGFVEPKETHQVAHREALGL